MNIEKLTKIECNRRFGIEIEGFGIERVNLQSHLREAGLQWTVKRDGSIQGNLPFEVVSPPLQGNEGLKQVAKVCEILNQHHAQINDTCGFHVHIDADTLSFGAIKNIAGAYAKYEDVIDTLIKPDRRGDTNHFCGTLKLGAYEYALENSRDLQELMTYRAFQDRYRKLNLHSLSLHHTIEFRQHHGAVEMIAVINWIKFCVAFVEVFKERTPGLQEFNRMSAKMLRHLSYGFKGFSRSYFRNRQIQFGYINPITT